MRKLEFYCDRCGSSFEPADGQCAIYRIRDVPGNTRKMIDLCQSCELELHEWLFSGVGDGLDGDPPDFEPEYET